MYLLAIVVVICLTFIVCSKIALRIYEDHFSNKEKQDSTVIAK